MKSTLLFNWQRNSTEQEKYNAQKDKLRFCVIGAGRIGKIHAENLATRIPGVQVAAIADVNLKAAQDMAAYTHAPWRWKTTMRSSWIRPSLLWRFVL